MNFKGIEQLIKEMADMASAADYISYDTGVPLFLTIIVPNDPRGGCERPAADHRNSFPYSEPRRPSIRGKNSVWISRASTALKMYK